MVATSLQHLKLLKIKVLSVSGFENIITSDCKVVSERINSKTNATISETTVKRLYGFAYSKFNPSDYTLNALSNYCNYNNWKDFCNAQRAQYSGQKHDELDWDVLQKKASRITQLTLNAALNRSVIPQQKTIGRAFINDHMAEFADGPETGSLLCAPAGYGKTVAICHWVKDRMAQIAAGDSNDAVLFLNTNVFMSIFLNGENVNDWILNLLGCSADTELGLLFEAQRQGGKFYLIIDGLEEHLFKNDQFKLLLDGLLDIFSLNEAQTWFKLLAIMRSSAWLSHNNESGTEAQKWFTAIAFKNKNFINVPLFNIGEIRQLSANINPAVKHEISIQAAEIFKHPLYFQYHFELNTNNFSLNNINQVTLYELVSKFIRDKVYQLQHGDENVAVIEKLINSIDVKSNNYTVDKLDVIDFIKTHCAAYYSLLGIGFIKEQTISDGYSVKTVIRFGSDKYLEYWLIKSLIAKSNNNLITCINNFNDWYAHSAHKTGVLKWGIIIAQKSGRVAILECLADLDLSPNEKVEIIDFLGDLFAEQAILNRNNWENDPYFNQVLSDKLFDYFFGLELINNNYKKTLHNLFKFKLSTTQKITVYSALGIVAALNLRLDELRGYIALLAAFETDDYQFAAINPLNCLNTIYDYLKFGVIKRPALVELTKLSFSSSLTGHEQFTSSRTNDLFYLLGLYTSLIFNNPKKTLRLIKVVKSAYYDHNPSDHKSEFEFFMQLLLAEVNYRLLETGKVSEIFHHISFALKSEEQRFTPYMKTMMFCLNIKHFLHTPQERMVIHEMKHLDAVSETPGSSLTNLITLFHLLNNKHFMLENPDFNKEITYKYAKLINKYHLSSHFMPQDLKTVNV